MIIDLIKHKNNNICVNYYTTASNSLKGKIWSPKNDSDLVWTCTDNRPELIIIANFGEKFKLKDVVFDADYHNVNSGTVSTRMSTNTYLIYEYSSDGCVWTELPYKYYDGSYYRFLEFYENGGNIYKKYAKSPLFINLKNLNKCIIVNEHEQQEEVDNLTLASAYVFKDSSSSYIYDMDIMFFRIKIVNVNVLDVSELIPFTLNTFEVHGEEIYDDIKEPLLVISSDRLFQMSYFEEYDFIPDQIQTYLKMLERNAQQDKERYTVINKNSLFNFYVQPGEQEIDIDIIIDDESTFSYFLAIRDILGDIMFFETSYYNDQNVLETGYIELSRPII